MDLSSSIMPYTQATSAEARAPKKAVLVTGANGYIGFAVCRAFARAGWRVYGLVRRVEAADTLAAEEIIPVIGSISSDLGFVDGLLAQASTRSFDVIVSCTEQIPFHEHWEHVLALVTKVAQHAQRHGIKPLVLVSSGCKDYGMTARHGAPGLAPHTEDSPLNAVDVIKPRTLCTLKIFEHAKLFDAAVLRPTPLYGYGSSYYGVIFDTLSQLQESGGLDSKAGVKVPGHDDNIYHGCHIDDCAEAYVALATHPVRARVNGECFNISGHRYETVGDIAVALSAEYGIEGGITAAPPSEIRDELRPLEILFGYTQWVDSTKIRKLTGWTDTKTLFSENLHVYRLAYEAAARAGDAGVARAKDRIAEFIAGGVTSDKS
ncbi:NAD(P)-binding protein [Xylariaceae sp. AK1471]|nr:NAD(P)-binding protein [Xylariaceae sp. AK1471]